MEREREILVKDGYCYEVYNDIQMVPTIIFDLKGNLIAGRKWLEDSVKANKEIEIQVLHVGRDNLKDWRKDATEKWQPHPQNPNHW